MAWRVRSGLLAITVAGAVAETAWLGLAGRIQERAMAPQVTATPPFGVFHDLRWLLVYHRSWTSFSWELVLLLVFRSALNGLLVRLSWPRDLPLPPGPVVFRRAFGFTVYALVALFCWALFLIAAAATSLAWFWYAGLLPALAVAVVIHPSLVDGEWWRLPSWHTIGWTLFSFVALTVTGSMEIAAPLWLACTVAVMAGLFNAFAWPNFVSAVLHRDRSHNPGFPLGPLTVLVIYAIMLALAHWGFRVMPESRFAYRQPAAPTGAHPAPVLIAHGFDSAWHGETVREIAGPYTEVPFSYRGLDASGRPRYYSAQDTHQSLAALAPLMKQQVEALYRRTGSRVVLVPDSEATLITQTYMAENPEAPVSRVLLLSPLTRPAEVYYPPDLRNDWGDAAGWGLRRLIRLIRIISPWKVKPDMPFVRSLMEQAPAMRQLDDIRATHAPEAALVPVAAAVVTPLLAKAEIPIYVIPALHGGILSEDRTNQAVLALLSGKTPRPAGFWRAVFWGGQIVGAPWRPPALGLDLRGSWAVQADGRAHHGLLPYDRVRMLLAAQKQ